MEEKPYADRLERSRLGQDLAIKNSPSQAQSLPTYARIRPTFPWLPSFALISPIALGEEPPLSKTPQQSTSPRSRSTAAIPVQTSALHIYPRQPCVSSSRQPYRSESSENCDGAHQSLSLLCVAGCTPFPAQYEHEARHQ
jgi:hypothetical protein